MGHKRSTIPVGMCLLLQLSSFNYIRMFITYNIYLCVCIFLIQLKNQNIVEVYSFMVINTLTMVYASFQVYQFRGFGNQCDAITTVGYLALVNVRMIIYIVIWELNLCHLLTQLV